MKNQLSSSLSSFSSPLSPSREIEKIHRYVDNLFDNFLGPKGQNTNLSNEFASPSFTPPCDIVENDTHYLLSLDVPGVKKEDIKVEFRDNVLTISGERSHESEERQRNRVRSEKSYGCFERSMSLPSSINADEIEANYQDGVLRVAIPKGENSKSQEIKIGEGKTGFWSRLLENKKDESKGKTH